MNEKLKELVNAVGALAEMTALYRKNLAEQGVPDNEAVRYTAAFVATMMGGGKNGEA